MDPMYTSTQSSAMHLQMENTTYMACCNQWLLSSMPPTSRGCETPKAAKPPCFCWRSPGMLDTALQPRVSTHFMTPPSCVTLWTALHPGSTIEACQWQHLKRRREASVCHLPLIMLWAPSLYLHITCCNAVQRDTLNQLHQAQGAHTTRMAGLQIQTSSSGQGAT
jgi:hypothetical protein